MSMRALLRRTISRLKGSQFLRRNLSRIRRISFDTQTATLGQAGQLIEAGNYNAAAQHLEGLASKRARTWRALLNTYLASHRFEELCAAYESMPEKAKADYDCRHLYLLALANLRRIEEVEQVIEGVLKDPDSDAAASFLTKTYLFTRRMKPDDRQEALGRLRKHAPWLAAEGFDSILKCAHHLRGQGLNASAPEIEDALQRAATDSRRRMKLDIFEGQIQFMNGRYDLQAAAVNSVLEKQGLNPIELIDQNLPFACENLTASPPTVPAERGPLVSILMPAYNSSGTIRYALKSLRNQTYQDIEVIVVDDASTDDTARIVAEFSALDPRISLLSLQRNAGAFVARNMALATASGEFVTNQDADDWAHPQKIATAIAELKRDRSIVATWVEHIRCSPQQGFRALNGYLRPDASSLMFRRAPVMGTIGWYDSVRAAGDGEFHLRLERSFGRSSIRQLSKLLSFVSWSESSLSGGGAFRIDSELGIFSPSRSAYRRSFGHWHETGERLYVPFPLKTRLFPAPDNLLSATASEPS